MKKSLLAVVAALLASPAWPNTLIDNVNGIQVGSDGGIQRFRALLIDDDGKVIRTIAPNEEDRLNVQKVIDEHGRTLMPGFIDAHGHVTDLGFAALHLDLTGSKSLAELQQRLRDYAAAHPNDSWLIGFGWNQELWPQNKFPTAPIWTRSFPIVPWFWSASMAMPWSQTARR